MFSDLSGFWKWLVVSSSDPNETALTVKGYVSSIVPVLMFLLHNPNLSSLPNDVYSFVVACFAAYSACATVYGLGRKIYLSFFVQPQ